MAAISLLNVQILKKEAPVTDSFDLEITFECVEGLQKGNRSQMRGSTEHRMTSLADLCTPLDLEWRLTYVGSSSSSELDQELDSLLVGPVPFGVSKFVFTADPPDLSRIPDSELLGVTVILLTGSYDGREFVRVGYYVNNEYVDEQLTAEPPAKPILEKIKRSILAEKPRVTRFAIKWYASVEIYSKRTLIYARTGD